MRVTLRSIALHHLPNERVKPKVFFLLRKESKCTSSSKVTVEVDATVGTTYFRFPDVIVFDNFQMGSRFEVRVVNRGNVFTSDELLCFGEVDLRKGTEFALKVPATQAAGGFLTLEFETSEETSIGPAHAPGSPMSPEIGWERVDSSRSPEIKTDSPVRPTPTEEKEGSRTIPTAGVRLDSLGSTVAQPPNMLRITVVEARNLLAVDGSGDTATSDPLVKIKCGKSEQRSRVVEKNNKNPSWGQKFFFPADVQHDIVKIVVEDYNKILANVVIGSIDFSVREISRRSDRSVEWEEGAVWSEWLELKAKRGKEEIYAGELLIRFKLECAGGTRIDWGSVEQGRSDSELDEEEEDEETPEQEAKRLEAEKTEADARKQKEEEFRKILESVQVVDGDYQVQVHVIEVRDLHPEDWDGSADPVVFIECFGQKANTKVKNNALSCVFDNLFSFELKDMNRELLEQGVINVGVYDADLVPGQKSVIGSFVTDFETVYFTPYHEMYRQWVPLIDYENPKDTGVQGYLQVSVTILGPNDKPIIHDRQKEKIEETKKLQKSGGDPLAGMTVSLPQVTQKLQFLVVTVYEARGLPAMDTSLLGRPDGLDAYVSVNFAGTKEVQTKIKTVKGGPTCDVKWMESLWMPYMEPCFSNNINIGVWDYDRIGSNEQIGTCETVRLQEVQKIPEKFRFRWLNIYGPPVPDIPTASLVEQTARDAKSKMLLSPDAGSFYRGKLLVSISVDENKGFNKLKQKVYKKKAKSKPTPNVFHVAEYTLRACIYSGAELPRFNLKSNRFFVRVSIGPTSLITRVVNATNGMCEWNEPPMQQGQLLYPTDHGQIPDVILTLFRGETPENGEPICFKRMKATDLLKRGFTAKADWIPLLEDKVINGVADKEYPGSLLAKIEFGLDESAAAQPLPRNPSTTLTESYQVNLHIFQARQLPSADDNGLLDPYFKVMFSGMTKKTAWKAETRDPLFYETLTFNVVLKSDKTLMPELIIQVWDHDNFSGDDFVGVIRMKIKDAKEIPLNLRNVNAAPVPTPRWYPLKTNAGAPTIGQVLLSLELIRKPDANAVVSPPPSLSPKLRKCYLDIVVLGLRELKSTGIVPVSKPFVEFRLGDGTPLRTTAASNRPSPTNPNFCLNIREEISLPVDALFAPCLNVIVKDRRLGGLANALLGTCSIPLDTKMPTSNGVLNPFFKAAGGEAHATNPFCEQEIVSPIPPIVEEETDALAFPTSAQIPEGPPGAEEKKSQAAEAEFRLPELGLAMPKLDMVKVDIPMPVNMNDVAGGLSSIGTALGDVTSGVTSGLASRLNALGGTLSMEETDAEDALLDEDLVPEYLVGRVILGGEMEDKLKSTPFECYPLFTGSMGDDIFDEPYHQVGYLKAVIRVVEESHFVPPEDIQGMVKPKDFQVRVYILKGEVAAKDDNGTSDPYLKLRLGKETQNGKKSFLRATTRPHFYTRYDFITKLPGTSQLHIDVMDWDVVGRDELIGATVIDLEDRWFSEKWRDLGQVPGSNQLPMKPLETRNLWAPTSKQPQGRLEMWVDIVPTNDLKKYPATDITPPATVDFEVRVIVWSCRNFPAGDFLTGMTDLYIKCKLGDAPYQSTDIHFRCPQGQKASFNWRMKFPVKLPLDDQPGASYFVIQAWDADLIYSDCLADTMYDLEQEMSRAFKKYYLYEKSKAEAEKKGVVHVFDTEQLVLNVFAKKKKKKKTLSMPFSPVPDLGRLRTSLGMDDVKPTIEQVEGAGEMKGVDEVVSGCKTEDMERVPLLGGKTGRADNASINYSAVEDVKVERMERGEPRKPEEKSEKKKGEAKELASDAEEMKGSGDKGKAGKKAKKKPVPTFYDRIADAMGFGPEPDNSKWIPLKHTEGDRIESRGELLISIEIIPSFMASTRPNGLGRAAPNVFPVLPDPVGRPDLSQMWNPFYLCRTCIGESLFIQFQALICCAILITAFVFLGSPVMSLIQLLMLLPGHWGWYLLGGFFVFVCVGLFWCQYKCKQLCCTPGKRPGDDDSSDDDN